MYGIFRISQDDSIVMDKDAVKLIPEITAISQEELKYIILVYDWFDSPLRRMPFEMRKIMAKRRVWKNTTIEPEKTSKVSKAIEAYKSICYDPIRNTADSLTTKIEILNQQLIDPSIDYKRAKDLVDQIDFFTERLYKLEQDIKIDDMANGEIKGKLKLSNLERWQKRQQEYAKINKLSID